MTSTALASLRPEDDEYLRKLMDRFGRTGVQIQNLNPEVALHSMFIALHPSKIIDSLREKPPGCMDELCERAKGYIQMEEMSRFRNEVHQAGQRHDKNESNTKANLHKSDKRHKPNKR